MSSGRPHLTEAQMAHHAMRLMRSHERMLADTVRNRAFHKALAKRVKPGCAVLDIGAGTGLWAIAAARLGASRVVAIEADEIMVGMIRRLAAECGVADRVQAVWGLSHQVQLDREFDLVVSETIGYDGFEEQIVPIMIDARDRFLREGGRVIPETVGLFAAAGHYRPWGEATPRGLPFAFPHFRELKLNTPVRLRERKQLRLIAAKRCLLDVDLEKPPLPSAIESMKASWSVEDASSVNCFAVWVEAQLAPGVRLSTRRTTSWTPVLYPIDPVQGKDATIELDLCLAGAIEWRTAVTTAAGTAGQVRSPLHAGRQMIQNLQDR